jgi:hypothetical protein
MAAPRIGVTQGLEWTDVEGARVLLGLWINVVAYSGGGYPALVFAHDAERGRFELLCPCALPLCGLVEAAIGCGLW